VTPWILWIAAAYLLGSIPFGVLIGRAKGVDVRAHGSKNIGATNVGRVLGRRWGVACFALDVLKGALPVLGAGVERGVIGQAPEPAGLSPPEMWAWLAVAAAAIAGHMASLFLGFRGGKGIATSFGAMLAMWPLLTIPALAALALWYAMLKATRYVSLASIAGALSVPAWYLAAIVATSGDADVLERVRYASPPLIVTSALALFVVWKHRGNLARLRRGEEPKAKGR
jgi:glycerol-3-phosphate acyltransferase PlsY